MTLEGVLTAAIGTPIAIGLVYAIVVNALGLAVARRSGVSLGDQEALLDAAPDAAADLHGYRVYFLIGALNEQEVIGGTVEALLRDQPGASVVVVDDGSDDATAEVVGRYTATGRVTLVSRQLPHAREGKGRALNAGISLIRDDVARTGHDPAKALVVVMDADGRMTPNATVVAADAFAADPAVGGLQLVVRIRNRHNLLTSFQDMEFWAASGLGQLGRSTLGSVSMGGNGQFTRLAALDEIGPEPWSESLTEDLDLCVSLLVRGWRTVSTTRAYVTQQGVGELGRLIRQRTRWYQGHMTEAKRLPEMVRSRHLPSWRFVELACYVLLPWTTTLPWSVLQQYVLYRVIAGEGVPHLAQSTFTASVAAVATWYVISFAPHLFWGTLYFRRAREVRLGRALWLAHLMLPFAYVTYLAAWKALARIVLRRNSWAKTRRESEAPPAAGGVAATSGAVVTEGVTP